MTRRNLHSHSCHHDRAQRAGAVGCARPRRAKGRDRLRRQYPLFGDLRLRPGPERIFAETTAAMPGAGLITWALNYRVDRARKDVTVTLLGFGRSHAVYREDLGCYLDHGDPVADITLPADDRSRSRRCCRRSREPAVVAPAKPQLPPRSIAPSPSPSAAVPPHQGSRGGQGRPCRRRALCRRLRHRHADARFLRDQVGDLGADRHSRAQGRAHARPARAGCGVAKRRRSAACDHGRSSAASHRGACARQFARRPRSAPRWSRSTA